MNSQSEYMYDIFISYASQDSKWAQQLEILLHKKGYNLFLDKKRLVAGNKWEDQLIEALYGSKHMIVLWSPNAEKSNWVNREIATFLAKRDLMSQNGIENQMLIFVMLGGKNQAYSSYHMLTQIMDNNHYPGEPSNVKHSVWDELVLNIENSISDDLYHISIPTAILTMTKDELLDLDPVIRPNDFSPSFKELLNDLKIGKPAQLATNYGPARSDWRLFSTATSIREKLDQVTQDMNTLNPNYRFSWQEIPAQFWGDDYHKVKTAASTLLAGPAFIFIDPLALYLRSVSSRISVIEDALRNPQAVIMIPPPVKLPESHMQIRILLKHTAFQFFNHFYSLTEMKSLNRAYCDLNINDDMDIRRCINATLAPLLMPQIPTKPVSNFLKV